MNAATDLLFGDVGEEALDQIDPGAVDRGEVNMPSSPRAEPLSDRQRLVDGVVVHDQAHVGLRGTVLRSRAGARTRAHDDADRDVQRSTRWPRSELRHGKDSMPGLVVRQSLDLSGRVGSSG